MLKKVTNQLKKLLAGNSYDLANVSNMEEKSKEPRQYF